MPSFSQMEVSRAERLHDERQRMTRPFLQPRFNGIRRGSGRRLESRDPEDSEGGIRRNSDVCMHTITEYTTHGHREKQNRIDT